MTAKPHPIFDRRIFWDVDFDKLDHVGKSGFIIERVFERGDVEDIRQCRRYYGMRWCGPFSSPPDPCPAAFPSWGAGWSTPAHARKVGIGDPAR